MWQRMPTVAMCTACAPFVWRVCMCVTLSCGTITSGWIAENGFTKGAQPDPERAAKYYRAVMHQDLNAATNLGKLAIGIAIVIRYKYVISALSSA